MPTIRPYQPGDKENVRRVCLHTKPEEPYPQLNPDRAASLATFCDYYIECEPQNCFVAADENDEAIGCIWCARDYRRYYARFKKDYLSRMKDVPLGRRIGYWGAAWSPRFYEKKYPAHLHIDVLDAYQRQGLGSLLMDALTAHLRAQGIPGVMLVVSARNEKGMNFYNKYGFEQVRRIGNGVVMGLRLG